LIQTPGGNIDATEKIISLLEHRLDNYRVVVPSWAKSAGTLLALSANKIVLGINSELGPIDPQWRAPNGFLIPCEILAKDPGQPYHVQQMADLTVQRTKKLANELLSKGMLKGKTTTDIDTVIAKISSASGYMSHGAVIDKDEADSLGLSVEYLEHGDDIWKKIWLLYCMYDFDIKVHNFGKIFEGSIYSIARPK
jgi:hypothetical protein